MVVVIVAMVMITVVIIVVMPTVMIPVVVMVPAVVVFEAAAVAVPVAHEITLAVMMRGDPAGARVGRLRPIAGVPLVVVTYWIPVAFDPDVALGRGRRWRRDHPRGWWRANLDSDRDLGAGCG